MGGVLTILEGDACERLRELPADSVQCCVTSPPYWGLRDYSCNGQLGLEADPETYVAKMVAVFREVRRVLRKDGTLWLNLGDSYAGGGNNRGNNSPLSEKQSSNGGATGQCAEHAKNIRDIPGLKPKDLCGIPWRVARALQEPYYTGKIKRIEDRIWLAATIEAEGCLFIHKRKAGTSAYSKWRKRDGTEVEYNRTIDSYGSGLEVSSTDKIVCDECLRITGLGSICEQYPEQNKRRKQRIYRWNLRTNECRDVIRELYPHLLAKKHEARLLIGCPSSGDKAQAAHESLKAIHQGCKPTIDFPAPASMFEEGWYLRCDIIWAKKNCMPESVTDRPTKSHEYLFLLTKASSYYYDAEAIKEKAEESSGGWQSRARNGDSTLGASSLRCDDRNDGGECIGAGRALSSRNKRSVWTVATAPYPDAHFATYPPDLIKPCIMAGTSAKGCCAKCGAPWERQIERGDCIPDAPGYKPRGVNYTKDGIGSGMWEAGSDKPMPNHHYEYKTLGWQPTCKCDAAIVPCTVLDPFAGSGTTGMVALELGRKAVLIELNPKYIELIRQRCDVTLGLALA